jgi:hypothetical protein
MTPGECPRCQEVDSHSPGCYYHRIVELEGEVRELVTPCPSCHAPPMTEDRMIAEQAIENAEKFLDGRYKR